MTRKYDKKRAARPKHTIPPSEGIPSAASRKVVERMLRTRSGLNYLKEALDEVLSTEITEICPFCGSKEPILQNSSIKNGPGPGEHFVECPSCGASSGPRDTKSDAVAAWNSCAGIYMEEEES